MAILKFYSGVIARLTFSVVAPRNHTMRIIGDCGEVSIDAYREYRREPRLERYSKLSLTARKFHTIRSSTFLQRLTGIGGKLLKLTHRSPAYKFKTGSKHSIRQLLIEGIRKREVYEQDKFVGVEKALYDLASDGNRENIDNMQYQINAITNFISNAGTSGSHRSFSKSFRPLSLSEIKSGLQEM